MSRFKKSVILFISLLCIGLILKKEMIFGASFLMIISLSALTIVYFIQGVRLNIRRSEEDNSVGVFISAYFAFSCSSIAFLFKVQYWSTSVLFLWISLLALTVLTFLVVNYFVFRFTTPQTEKKILRELLIPYLLFAFFISISIVTNQREFHNFFRGSTYESYIRKLYPEKEAQKLLEANQCNDISCLVKADKYYLLGLKNDSLQQWDVAYEHYNKAIDYNIYFKDAYYRRATNRMLHKEIDKDITNAAIRDCDIAISLDSNFVLAYVRRGFTYYLDRHPDEACRDLTKAKSLDSTLTIDKYIKNTCGSSSNK